MRKSISNIIIENEDLQESINENTDLEEAVEAKRIKTIKAINDDSNDIIEVLTNSDCYINIVKNDNHLSQEIKGHPLLLLIMLNKTSKDIRNKIGMSDAAYKLFIDTYKVVEEEEEK